MSATDTTLQLHDGTSLPAFGVGLYKVPSPEVGTVVDAALDAGYRLFDTATMYENEAALGEALEASGIPRSEVTVASKVLNSDQGRGSTREAFLRSLESLHLDALDLYLIHWPAPRQNLFEETWEEMLELQAEGLIRSVGVSNFHPHHLDRIIERTGVAPSVNQVECHPWLQQEALRAHHAERGIAMQAWSPLARGKVLDDPTLTRIGDSHGVDAAAVALAWQLDRGVALVVKSSRPERLRANLRAGEVRLTDSDRADLASLERGFRTGMDPDDRD